MTDNLITITDTTVGPMGSIFDIKEERNLLPVAKDVKLLITKVRNNDTDRDGNERKWKFLDVDMKLVDGIDVNGEMKYKDSLVFGRICYDANRDGYDFSKPFFAKKQYLIQLKNLMNAVGFSDGTMNEAQTGLAGASIQPLIIALENKLMLGSIKKTKDKETGEENGNEVYNFKALPETMLA